MKMCVIDYASSLVTDQEFVSCRQRLIAQIKQIQCDVQKGYDSPYASLYLPGDYAYFSTIEHLIAKKKALSPAMILVIGIGGSNLGAMAVQQALYGLFYNEQGRNAKIYYIDSVDPDYTHDILERVRTYLSDQAPILLVIISKSGTTLETLANAAVFLDVLKHWHPQNYQEYVVVITDQHSPLYLCAQENKFDVLIIPKNVGGRYSVLSASGLFVLGMIGIDIAQLKEGAAVAVSNGLLQDIVENQAALLATILYSSYQKGYTIIDFFAFSAELEMLGKWYRQLVGESLGKDLDTHGKKVHAGIVPTVSIGTTDLHSVGQLYLSGPHTIFTNFVIPRCFKTSLNIPRNSDLCALVPTMKERSYSFIMHSVLEGMGVALARQKRPFVAIELAQKDAFCIGYFMQLLMMQIMYVGYLMDVNPFDQPHVELYKKETRKILGNE